MPTPNDFSNFQFGKDNSAERQQSNMGSSGDYGAVANAPTTDVPMNDYPNLRGYGYDRTDSQFSRDKNWEPQAMADEASGQSSTANDLIGYLNTSPYTMGSRVCHELDEPQTPAHPSGGSAGPGDGRTGPDDGGE
jgi:hypothetical protein